VAEDNAVSGNVLTNDYDVEGSPIAVTKFTVAGDATNYAAGQTATIAGKGTLTLAASGAWTFTPAANWNGTAPVVTYTVTDGTDTSTSTLTVTVTPVNDAPVGVADSFSFARNTTGTGNVLANDIDVDGDVLSITAISIPGFIVRGLSCTMTGKGTITFTSNGSFTFVPVTGWFGTLPTVTYTLTDGTVTSTSTLTIKVL
jgi:VCBS repeat-containing protein